MESIIRVIRSKHGWMHGTRNLDGFLTETIVCECEICSCKDKVMLVNEGNNGYHKVYKIQDYVSLWWCVGLVWCCIDGGGMGCGWCRAWRKRWVFLVKGSRCWYMRQCRKVKLNEQAYLVFILEVILLFIIYMREMVLELDEKVLLVTNHQLSMPHCLRISAIVCKVIFFFFSFFLR